VDAKIRDCCICEFTCVYEGRKELHVMDVLVGSEEASKNLNRGD